MSRQPIWLLALTSLIVHTPEVFCFIMTDPSNEITFEQFAMQATAEIKNLKTEVNALKAQAAKNVIVAFHTEMTNDVTIQEHSVVRFNNVNINIGSGYNNGSGVFRAPVSGIYLILLQVYSKPQHHVALSLYKQGTAVNEAVAGTGGYQSSTVAEMLHLNQGEDVWVQHIVGETSIRAYHHTQFLGYLLKAD
ncbi:multimerin-2-like [Gigantopelta aegis]|uniref:multimerin-2-like n=1 Tax=Gigantopelta aegis TaxID=1735272 RepID=UPI001B887C77|nr:multimerin-2-like [Gigantopelta aegis]